MDLQKEIDSLKVKAGYDGKPQQWQFGFDLACRELAKAQAVPAGYVVLKISDVRDVISNASDAMCDEAVSTVFSETGIPSTWYDHYHVAEKNIIDVIEAREQK